MGSSHYIQNLPDDILVEIFSYLSFGDLVHSVYHVSSRFHDVSQDSRLWRKLQYQSSMLESDDKIVNILRQTPKLQTLDLSSGNVRSPVLHFLKNCSDLRRLKFSCYQKLSEKLVKSMVLNCQNLEYLTIPDTNLRTLERAEMIGQFQNLRTLNIVRWCGYRPHSVWLRPIGDGCPMLQHLYVQHQGLNIADFKYFIQMKQHQLESIKVCWYDKEGEEGSCIIPHLIMCKALKRLSISSLNTDDASAGYAALRCMKNITCLSFVMPKHVDVNDLVPLFSNRGMSHLIELTFNTYWARDDGLSETICNNCPLLKVLCYVGSLHMTDSSLRNLHKLKDLEHLSLCPLLVTDSSMDFVIKCKSLTNLNLVYCSTLTERSMNQLIHLNKLQTLKLDYCNIERFPLSLIPTVMTKLRLLSIKSCVGIKFKDVCQLRAKMPHLTLLTD